jgi:hypothetical protein
MTHGLLDEAIGLSLVTDYLGAGLLAEKLTDYRIKPSGSRQPPIIPDQVVSGDTHGLLDEDIGLKLDTDHHLSAGFHAEGLTGCQIKP